MNIPRYEFCIENKALIAKFLKKAEECKSNKFCNLKEHERLTKILPINDELKDLLIEEVIDITQSDDEVLGEKTQEITSTEDVFDASQSSQEFKNETAIDDIAYAIKENLESEKCLSTTVVANLQESDLNLADVFTCLSHTLNYEEVLNFGFSLLEAPISDGRVEQYFIKHLLVKQLIQEFSDQLQLMYNNFGQRHSNILMEEVLSLILNTQEDYTKAFLQYLVGSKADFKSKLFRNFIFNCNSLQENHIPLIEALHNPSEIDSLNKLVELMSMSVNNYTTSKPFGKLLLNVIKAFGKNIHIVEKPMNHIIANHKSVWKGKIEKLYSENFHDSISMSQSFRY